MSLHIGNRRTLKLLCGANLRDKFWITIGQQRMLRASERTAQGASCKACLKLFYVRINKWRRTKKPKSSQTSRRPPTSTGRTRASLSS